MTGDSGFIRSCDLALYFYRKAKRSETLSEVARVGVMLVATAVWALVLVAMVE